MKGTDSVVSILSWFDVGGVVDSVVTSFLQSLLSRCGGLERRIFM